MDQLKQSQDLLDDFILMDCRLGNHPQFGASVWLKEGDGLRCIADTGVAREAVRGRSLTLGGSVIEHTLAKRCVVSVESIDHDLHVSGNNWIANRGVRSLLSVPMLESNGAKGVLSVYNLQSGSFKQENVHRVQVLAAVLQYVLSDIQKVRTEASLSLGKAMAGLRNDSALDQADLALRVQTSRIAISRWEAGAQPPSIGSLRRWCEALELLAHGKPALVTVVDVSPQLIELLRNDPGRMRELSPETFERLVAERLAQMGFEVKLTGDTFRRDGGIDLIAVPKAAPLVAYVLAGQVKHHRTDRKTDRQAVDRLLAWQGSTFRLGLLVTNTCFTRDALWRASESSSNGFLRLRDFEDLKRWLGDNFWDEAEWKELPETIVLAPGITVPVPRPKLRTAPEFWQVPHVNSNARSE